VFRDLRTQLLLWTILPLAIILIGVAYLGVNSHQASMRNLVEERDGLLARVAAARLSEAISNRAAILRALDPYGFTAWDAQRAEFDGGMASFDLQGNLLNAIPSRDIWEMRRAATANVYVPRSTFSTLFTEGGAPRVLIAVQNGGEVLAGVFTLPSITDLGIGPRGVAYIVDEKAKIIAHPEPNRIGQDLSGHEGILEAARGESGATFHHAADGSELVVGYAPISSTNWSMIIEEPWADVVAPMFQYSVLMPLVLLLVAIGALGGIYFGVRNILRPLQELAQMANRIAFGAYDAAERPVGGLREIDELRETLDAMARQVKTAQEAMQNYIVAITRGQEDERLRLARELHDDTIQSLIALQQRVELAHKALDKDPALAAKKIAELQSLLTQSLDSVRRFIRDLRPTYLEELGLLPALEMLTREASAQFEVQGDEQRLDAERELALYRIVQEALSNIKKHARAKHIGVRLAFDTGEVTATVEDDGVGFDAPESPSSYARAGHFGLMGMQERAQLFGGNVYVKSVRDKGTKLVAYVPIK
jgi:signal transduction histidine kinase